MELMSVASPVRTIEATILRSLSEAIPNMNREQIEYVITQIVIELIPREEREWDPFLESYTGDKEAIAFALWNLSDVEKHNLLAIVHVLTHRLLFGNNFPKRSKSA